MLKQLLVVGLAAIFALAGGLPSEAVTLNQGLTPNLPGIQNNTLEDQDREAYIDVNENGLFDVGDLFIGFVRIDDFGPSGLSAENQVYAILATEITAITEVGSNTFVSLGASTVPGLTLPEITGDDNTAGGMFAVYDAAAPFTVDLINDSAPPALSIKDDIDLILAEGTLRLTVGILPATGDFFTVTQAVGFEDLPGGPNAGIVGLQGGVTVGAFTGGLSILYNNTNFSYADTVQSVDPLTGLQMSQVAVASGTIRGSADDGQQAVFTNASGYTDLPQCSVADVNTPCGFITDADFLVRPTQVPVPASLLLVGGGILAAAVGLRRKR